MDKQECLIEDLNQLLKGTYMGTFVFDDLRDKIKHHELQMEFFGFLEKLKAHEHMLIKHIKELGGEPVDSAGIKGTISEIMSMLKNLVITKDEEVIQEALKSIDMGQKALRDFDDHNAILSKKIAKEIRIMSDDYSSIYHTIHKYLVKFKD